MVPGVFTSDQGIVGTRRGDFASAILQAMPDGSAPLLALSSGMPRENATDVIITWFEEQFQTGRVQATNNAGTGVTITVDDASGVFAGQIYLVEPTGERVYVTAVTGSDLTVVRAFGEGQTAQALDGSGTPVGLQRIGTAFEEGSSRPPAVAYMGYPIFNYCQIFRNSWDATLTAQQVSWTTGNHVAKNKRDCMSDHSIDIERSAWFGVRGFGVKNNKPFRTMDGIMNMIKTNVTSQVTNTTWDDIDEFLRPIFQYNVQGKPNERIAFCGDTVVTVLNKIARLNSAGMNLDAGQTEWGMKVMKWITPFGSISLMRHPLFSINPVWTKMLVILHPGSIVWKYLRNTSWDNYDRSGSRAGVDADYGVLTSELSMKLTTEKTAGIFTGIDTAAADA